MRKNSPYAQYWIICMHVRDIKQPVDFACPTPSNCNFVYSRLVAKTYVVYLILHTWNSLLIFFYMQNTGYYFVREYVVSISVWYFVCVICKLSDHWSLMFCCWIGMNAAQNAKATYVSFNKNFYIKWEIEVNVLKEPMNVKFDPNKNRAIKRH